MLREALSKSPALLFFINSFENQQNKDSLLKHDFFWEKAKDGAISIK